MKLDCVAHNEIKLDFNDILIKPCVVTDIESRTMIDTSNGLSMLPLFTAPMDTVVNDGNAATFEFEGINVCLPRGETGISCNGFTSYSLKGFIEIFIDGNTEGISITHPKILIDTANGHLDTMVDAIKKSKKIWKNGLTLMVGNVANAETYKLLSNAGADYVRVGIGNGGGCLTTQQTGVGFPMASLIRECYYMSLVINKPAKIVADGGMKSYSDVIKALALGADYVMLGSILNKCLESCGDNFLWKKIPVTQISAEKAYGIGVNVYKKFRGMSTKEVQKKWGNLTPKTSEGVIRFRKVEYTIEGWIENFESYLRSAMSYSDSRNLEEFVNKVEFIKISNNAHERFKK